MAEIKPFKALRFTEKAGKIQDLVCPPYDIISDEQRRRYLERNPHNVIRLELPREGEDVYAEAGRVLNEWLAEGVISPDRQDCLYIYEEEFSIAGCGYSFRGIVCRVKLEEFSKGIVLPHEETLSKAKNDRFSLMSATNCNFSQIYSLYADEGAQTSEKINKLADRKPDIEFEDADGIIQRLWIVSDEAAIAAVCKDFASRKLYIADGHHRYETALNYRDHLRKTAGAKPGDACDDVMMMLVDIQNPGLVVFPTHRIVQNLESFDEDALLSQCRDYFDICSKPLDQDMEEELKALYEQGEKAFGYYGGGDQWTLLVLKDKTVMKRLLPGKSESLATLDVTVLHSLVLERLLGIDVVNMANQKNLVYTRDAAEAVTEVQNGRANCCFVLNPTRVSEIAAVAAAGEKMPQKSTYFYPKLITGLVMNQF